MITIGTVDEFLNLKEQSLGISDWLLIDQGFIDRFADSTLDHQWIHVDEVKASEESPYGRTIAHGYLQISLIPYFLDHSFKVDNIERIVNYGIDKMVFKAPVPVNSRLRMKTYLKSAKDLGDICMANIQCIFEIEGSEEPVLEGQIKYLYYFKDKSTINK